MIPTENMNTIEGLKWYPWIGENYSSMPTNKRMLIVGESHYLDPSSPEKLARTSKNHSSPEYTRLVVKEIAIDNNAYSTKFFAPLQKSLLGKVEFDRELFWQNVAFFNLIQESMGHKRKRPSKSDFLQGFKVFAELVTQLEPELCLMVGTTSSKFIRMGLKDSNLKLISLEKTTKISNAFAKSALLATPSGKQVRVEFIKHSSQYYSWKKWGNYLETKVPEILEWHRKTLCLQKPNFD